MNAAVTRRARRDLAVLVASAAISQLGSSLTLLAVLVHLRPLGAGWVTASFAAEAVPAVALAPLAGHLVDALPNRRLLSVTLLVQAGAAGGAAAGMAPGRQVLLLAALVMLGAGSSVTGPAVAALLPAVAGEEGATRAYGWSAACSQAGFVTGFAIGGLLIAATSVARAVELDAASYAVMAFAVAALRTDRVPERERADPADALLVSRGWARGFSVLARDRLLAVVTLSLAAAVMVSVVINVAEVFFVLGTVGASTATYGVVNACWPAAGVAAGWACGRLRGQRALALALGMATVLMGIGFVIAAVSVAVWGLALGWLLGGAANAVQNVAQTALVRSRTEAGERGRVFAASSALVQGANLLGLAVGGALVAAVGARASLLVSGVVTCLIGVAAWAATAVLLRTAS